MHSYLRARIAELHAVTWPTQRQATHAMVVVLVIMLLVGLFITVTDWLLNDLVLFLMNR